MKKFLITLFYLLFLFCSFSNLRAQNYASQAFSDLHDFDVKTIYKVIQSKDERLWMGTNQGIFCFNQREIKRFADSRFQSEFSNLIEDSEGRIWFQNFSGHIFYIENDSLHLFKDLSSYTRDGLITVDISRFPTIYANSEHGIFEFDFNDAQKNQIYTFSEGQLIASNSDNLRSSPVENLIVSDDDLYFIVASTIYRYHKGRVEKIVSVKERIKFLKVDDRIVALEVEKNGQLIFYLIEGSKYKEVSFENFRGVVSESLHYIKSENQFWLGTQKGFYIFDKNLKRINFNPIQKNLFITSFWQDVEGNYLLGTLNEGLQIVPNLIIQVFNKDNSSLSTDNVVDIISGPDYSFFILDEQNNVYQLFSNTTQPKLLYQCDQRVSSIYYNKGLEVIHLFPSDKQLNLNNLKPEKNKLLNIKAFNSFDSATWLVSQSGQAIIASVLNSQYNNYLKPYAVDTISKYQELDIMQLPIRKKRSISNLIIDKDFYVSYSDALFYYGNGQSEEITFEGNPIVAIDLIHHSDDVWVATTDGSLFLINKKREIKKMASVNVAIKNLDVYSDDIIIVGSKAIFSFQTNSGELMKLDHTNGLITSEIHKGKVFLDHLYVATHNGLFHFPLDFMKSKNLYQPQLNLDGVKINGKAVNLRSIEALDYLENNIRFEFSTYALKSQNTYQLAYRFKNKDDNWHYSNGLELSFNALQPGNYELLYKLINEDGIESQLTQPIVFAIAFPFYQQAWFYGLSILLSILIIGGFFNYRLKVQKEKAHLQQRLAISTLSSIKAQMNPHFIFNAINSVQHSILKGDKNASYKYLNKLSVILRNILAHSEKDFIDAEEELKMIISYLDLEQLRFNGQLTYEIEGQDQLQGIELPSMVIQPFVENAVKHGLLHKSGSKKVIIRFELKEYLLCEITDNGIGRTASGAIQNSQGINRNSFSTSSIQKRFAILKEYYELNLGFDYEDLVENDEPSGTKVILRIPFN